jgi:MFS family permease
MQRVVCKSASIIVCNHTRWIMSSRSPGSGHVGGCRQRPRRPLTRSTARDEDDALDMLRAETGEVAGLRAVEHTQRMNRSQLDVTKRVDAAEAEAVEIDEDDGVETQAAVGAGPQPARPLLLDQFVRIAGDARADLVLCQNIRIAERITACARAGAGEHDCGEHQHRVAHVASGRGFAGRIRAATTYAIILMPATSVVKSTGMTRSLAGVEPRAGLQYSRAGIAKKRTGQLTPLSSDVLMERRSAGTQHADTAVVQRRTLRLLFATQIISGVGVAIGASVGALLAAEMAGVGLSGLAQSAVVVGGALFAVPATAIVRRHGRRPSLALSYLAAATGGIVVVAAAMAGSIPLLFAGFFLFGGSTTAGLQARYAAVDLAPAALRGRQLSLIVWATTLGAVAGPNLAPLAGATLDGYGVPTLAGPFFFAALLFSLAATVLLIGLRPDPIRIARAASDAAGETGAHDQRSVGMRAALRAVVSHSNARLGVSAVAVGHLVMIGVMAMTPVHIRGAGHEAAHTLRIVGVVLSVHIAGMFAFAPVMGWLTDRFGRRLVIGGGIALLLAACAMAGTAGHDATRLGAALMVLGLGWSATMVAGSTLLSESVPAMLRASAQGLSDLIMGLAGATAAALSGVVVNAWGYPALALLAALTTAPLIVLAARTGSVDAVRPDPQPVTLAAAE